MKDKTTDKGVSRLRCSILMVGASLLGTLISAVLILGVAPRYAYIFEPRCDIASHTLNVPSEKLSQKVNSEWYIVIRDIVDNDVQKAESRLRDHFTLLLTVAGIATTLILGVFSLIMARQEDKAISNMKDIESQAREILDEILNYREAAHKGVDKINKNLNQIDESLLGKFHKDNAFLYEETLSIDHNGIINDTRKNRVDNIEERSSVNSFDKNDKSDMYKEDNDACKENGKSQNDLDEVVPAKERVEQKDSARFTQCFNAAEQGHAIAQFNLANMYRQGLGVSRNLTRAAEWYEKAAEQGLATAQFNLANMYRQGLGVARNLAQAAEWYEKAAEQGLDRAQFNLALMYNRGEGVKQSAKNAVKWYEKAAEQGHATAQFNLANMYRLGLGVARNLAQAAEWYEKAAEQGLDRAQFALGMLYDQGKVVTKDKKTSTFWYLKAAEQGHPAAALEMCKRYLNGNGVPENYVKAYTFFILYKSGSTDDKNSKWEDSIRETLTKLLTSEQIFEAQKEAAVLWENRRSSEL